MTKPLPFLASCVLLCLPRVLLAGTGDPQLRTDHPWYPGELSCSTFERLFATQAELYQRVVGVKPQTDEQKALAAWFWRNLHYYHGMEGTEDIWGRGTTRRGDTTREYWTGLFAHGFGLCFATHAQWTAEMEALLGHNRARGVGAAGHLSFEVFLSGGPYSDGKWVLLDHDISTVIFNQEGTALLGLAEIQKDWKRLSDRNFAPERQQGWLICGLHAGDGQAYSQYSHVEYLAGYGAVPPLVHLRRGEKLRRYLEPGLEDGTTFVFWGHNYKSGGTPGPERSLTWVNQPDKMFRSPKGTGFKPGQARYGNAVYTYQPDFSTLDYREGIVAEAEDHVVFEFHTPYIIAATPANDKPWGIYDPGSRNGLVLHGKANCRVSVSTDRGKTWQDGGLFTDGIDLTDLVKGKRQYFLKLHAGAKVLRDSGLTITTVCQANPTVMPHLKEDGSQVQFLASDQAVLSAGPNLVQAEAHLVAGKFGSSAMTLELATPRKESAAALYAAAHFHSGNPPAPDIKYHIDFSTDGGKTWQPLVKDWIISRRGHEPGDFWSQSYCWGSVGLTEAGITSLQVRFCNCGGKSYGRCEAHVVYRTARSDATKVTFDWLDDKGAQRANHTFSKRSAKSTWHVPTGQKVKTRWVEFEPVIAKE